MGAWDENSQEALRAAGVWHEVPRPGRPEREDRDARWDALYDRLLEPDGVYRDGPLVDMDDINEALQRCAVGLGFTRDELEAFERQFVEELVVTWDSGNGQPL